MDHHHGLTPVISEVLTVMSGQIMKTKTVITFVPNIDHQNEVNQDISNATNNLEKMNFENQGKMAKIVRPLHGGKAAGHDFRNSLRSCVMHLDFDSCKADPDVWMRKTIKSDGGSRYWEYVLLYTDDALVVSENGERVLREEI